MATDHLKIPARYLRENPLDYATPDDYWRYGENAVILVGEFKKAMWTENPDWRLVQVYSIQFLNSDGKELDREELGQICGKIVLKGIEKVFGRKPGQGCHDIDPKGFVRLSGPRRPSWAADYVDIMAKMYKASLGKEGSEEDEIFLASPEDFQADTCDELLTKHLQTPCGTMHVAYAILSDSADCYVTIKILQWAAGGGEEEEGSAAANIYGTIVASDTLVTDERAKSFVFRREKDEEISVQEGQYIPLQRPSVAVSMGHHLELDMRIFHKNDTGGDSLILENKVKFRAKCGNAADLNGINEEDTYDSDGSLFSSKKSDNSSKDSDEESDNGNGGGVYVAKQIYGKSCKFQVKVYWLPCWSSPACF